MGHTYDCIHLQKRPHERNCANDVMDLDQAITFEQDMLGFATIFHNPTVFALLQREGVKIGLQRTSVAQARVIAIFG